MARVLGINAVFHDPAAALVVDGETVAAAEEERFSRRKHGKEPVPFSAWELPVEAARWCLRHAGLDVGEVDAVAYSYDPALAPAPDDLTADEWEGLRTLYARRAPRFLATALPGLDPARVTFVPHHVAHAASAHLAAPFPDASVLVLDGRGETASHLAGRSVGGDLEVLASQTLPHSLGLLYEEVTDHLGFKRSSDEYKVMALASYGDRDRFHAELTLAGGVALNCVANARLAAEGPFDHVWVQPAAGDAGTALGAALFTAHASGDRCLPMRSAALGRGWSDAEIEAALVEADVVYERPRDLAAATAAALAAGAVVGWFEGRSEYGPRALGHRSLLVDPRRADNLARMNAIKGREEFRPVAPMVLAERADEIFEGVHPSPYMLFVHRVRPAWRDRIPAVVHVDGTARIQTVDRRDEPLVAALLDAFAARTGVPVLVNTSFNTAGRPMVDTPRQALEVAGSSPVDPLVVGPFLVRRRQSVVGE